MIESPVTLLTDGFYHGNYICWGGWNLHVVANKSGTPALVSVLEFIVQMVRRMPEGALHHFSIGRGNDDVSLLALETFASLRGLGGVG